MCLKNCVEKNPKQLPTKSRKTRQIKIGTERKKLGIFVLITPYERNTPGAW